MSPAQLPPSRGGEVMGSAPAQPQPGGSTPPGLAVCECGHDRGLHYGRTGICCAGACDCEEWEAAKVCHSCGDSIVGEPLHGCCGEEAYDYCADCKPKRCHTDRADKRAAWNKRAAWCSNRTCGADDCSTCRGRG